MHAIFVRNYGGPEVMTWTEVPDPVPGPGEALVRLAVAGVNYMDTGVRHAAHRWALRPRRRGESPRRHRIPPHDREVAAAA
jgi:NADPH:quinone reductase-like Zn-dependent oxidoreductase